jgi:hypothetical protein
MKLTRVCKVWGTWHIHTTRGIGRKLQYKTKIWKIYILRERDVEPFLRLS